MVRLHHQLLIYVSGSWEDYWNSGSIDLTELHICFHLLLQLDCITMKMK